MRDKCVVFLSLPHPLISPTVGSFVGDVQSHFVGEMLSRLVSAVLDSLFGKAAHRLVQHVESRFTGSLVGRLVLSHNQLRRSIFGDSVRNYPSVLDKCFYVLGVSCCKQKAQDTEQNLTTEFRDHHLIIQG